MTLSFSKFFVYSDEEGELYMRCSVCGQFNVVGSRLDDLVCWAEQHECTRLSVT